MATTNVDGDVKLKLGFDTGDAEHAISALGKKIARTFELSGGADPLATLTKDIETTQKNIDEITKKLEEFAGKTYKIDLSADIEKTKKELEDLRNAPIEGYEDLSQVTGEELDATEQRNIERVQERILKIEELENELKRLEEASKVEYKYEETEAYKKLNEQLVQQKSNLNALTAEYNRLNQPEDKNVKTAKKSSKERKNGLINILKYALGIRTLYTLISRIKSAMKEGIKWVGNYSNAMKTNLNKIKGSFNMVKASIGAAAAPLINVLTPVIVKVAQALTTAGNAVAKFMAILTGQKTVILAKKNIEAYTEALEKGSKALGKYDKLNVIDKNEDTEGADYFETLNTADIEKTGLLALADKLRIFFTETVPTFFKNLKEWWAELDTPTKIAVIVAAIVVLGLAIWGIISAVNKVKETVEEAANPVAGLVDVFGKALILAEVIILLYALKEVIDALSGLITAFAESNLKWYDVLLLLVSIFGTLALAMWAMVEIIDHNKLASLILIGVLISLSDVLDSCAKLIEAFGNSGLEWYDVFGLVAGLLVTLVGLFGAIALIGPSMTAGLLPFIAVMVTLALTLDPILSAISDFIVETAPALVEVITAIGDAISKIIDVIGSVITDTLEGISDIIDSVTNLLMVIDDKGLSLIITIGKIVDAIDDLIDEIKDLAKVVNDKFPAMKTTIKSNWDTIYSTISNGVNKLKNSVLSSLVTYVKNNVFNSISNYLNSFKTSFKNVLNIMCGYLQNFANAVITSFNAVIRSINSLGLSVPSWVPNYGGRSWYPNLSTISTITIPRLATGAVLPPNSPFLAMLGDQKSGTNIEAPLETIKQALAEVMTGKGGTNQPIILQVDGKTLAKVVWNENEKRYKQIGKNYAY